MSQIKIMFARGWSTSFTAAVAVALCVVLVADARVLLAGGPHPSPSSRSAWSFLYPGIFYDALFFAVFVIGTVAFKDILFSIGIAMLKRLPSDSEKVANMEAKFTELMEAENSDEYTPYVFMPFTLMVVCICANIFKSDSAWQDYNCLLRLTLQFGWIFACPCIPTFILSRRFTHLKVLKVVLFFFGLLTLLMLFSMFHAYLTLRGYSSTRNDPCFPLH